YSQRPVEFQSPAAAISPRCHPSDSLSSAWTTAPCYPIVSNLKWSYHETENQGKMSFVSTVLFTRNLTNHLRCCRPTKRRHHGNIQTYPASNCLLRPGFFPEPGHPKPDSGDGGPCPEPGFWSVVYRYLHRYPDGSARLGKAHGRHSGWLDQTFHPACWAHLRLLRPQAAQGPALHHPAELASVPGPRLRWHQHLRDLPGRGPDQQNPLRLPGISPVQARRRQTCGCRTTTILPFTRKAGSSAKHPKRHRIGRHTGRIDQVQEGNLDLYLVPRGRR